MYLECKMKHCFRSALDPYQIVLSLNKVRTLCFSKRQKNAPVFGRGFKINQRSFLSYRNIRIWQQIVKSHLRL